MARTTTSLIITFDDQTQGDELELERATIALRRHLLDIDEVVAVDPLELSDVPEGTKAAEVFAIAGLAVSVLSSASHLRAVIGAARTVLHPGRSVTLVMEGDSLTVTGVDSQEQQRLIELWLQRHIQEKRP